MSYIITRPIDGQQCFLQTDWSWGGALAARLFVALDEVEAALVYMRAFHGSQSARDAKIINVILVSTRPVRPVRPESDLSGSVSRSELWP